VADVLLVAATIALAGSAARATRREEGRSAYRSDTKVDLRVGR
jgi:hypothetical protein